MYHTARQLFFAECHCADDGSQTYEDLFAKLDANKDGKVDVSELKAGLAAMGISSGKGAAQVESPETAAGRQAVCAKWSQGEGEEEDFPSFHSSSNPPPGLSHAVCCFVLTTDLFIS